MTTETSGVHASTLMQDTYYTTEEVRQQLRVAHSTVRRWMSLGKLRYLKIDGAVRIPASALAEHLRGGDQ
ncbi:helix-turn-helix domain-containing protein [Deinococcus sp.]|uniref:helix-turn-helix domain-containing protein n=1 Tax=Deinococcus sp. TaxID=47478 RepID=UPI0025B805F5|nr:helix-turn-helix domain-containing protein [Deinococcus sp.]